jgi:hypothetical protein
VVVIDGEMGLVLLHAETEWPLMDSGKLAVEGVVWRWTEHGCAHVQMVAQNRIRAHRRQKWRRRGKDGTNSEEKGGQFLD